MHSPGPWTLSRDDREGMEWNIHIVQQDAPHMTVCFMTSDGPNEDNAKLIAAAPDLLAALERIGNPEFRYSTDDDEDTQLSLRIADARAAIARVR